MATTFTVLTSAFNDGATDPPAAARAQYYNNWTQVNKITDEGTADSVVKTTATGDVVSANYTLETIGDQINTPSTTTHTQYTLIDSLSAG